MCITVLSSAVFVFGALIIVGLLVCKRYPCSGRVAGTQYKPGLIGTPDGLLNTVPSEYVDDGFMLQRIKSEVSAQLRKASKVRNMYKKERKRNQTSKQTNQLNN